MKPNQSSKPVLALVSLVLIFTGFTGASADNHTSQYPPVPTPIPTPPVGVPAKIIVEIPPLNPDNEVFIPKAPTSNAVVRTVVVPASATALAALNDGGTPTAVQVQTGLVIGGVNRNAAGVAKVQVNSNSEGKSEIQVPQGTPTAISLGGYEPGARVTVTVKQGNKTVVLGVFTATSSGRLNLPTTTATGTANQEFSFKTPGEPAKKVVVRPTAPKAGFSTLKASFTPRG